MAEPRDTRRSGDLGKRGSLTSDLGARIARAGAGGKVVAEGNTPAAAKQMTGMARGLRLGSEFVAAILVGLGIGYLLDQWLHTTPWLMLVFLMVGFAAGVLNVVRSAAEMNRAAGAATGAPPVPDDDEDDEE